MHPKSTPLETKQITCAALARPVARHRRRQPSQHSSAESLPGLAAPCPAPAEPAVRRLRPAQLVQRLPRRRAQAPRAPETWPALGSSLQGGHRTLPNWTGPTGHTPSRRESAPCRAHHARPARPCRGPFPCGGRMASVGWWVHRGRLQPSGTPARRRSGCSLGRGCCGRGAADGARQLRTAAGETGSNAAAVVASAPPRPEGPAQATEGAAYPLTLAVRLAAVGQRPAEVQRPAEASSPDVSTPSLP